MTVMAVCKRGKSRYQTGMARKGTDTADQAFMQLTEQGCTSLRLQSAARLSTQLYAQYLGGTGLTGPQFGTLAFLFRDDGHSVGMLATLLDTDQTTLTRNLRLLEQRGLVKQEVATADRRRRIIRLTPEGRRLFRRALPLWQQAQAELARRLGPAQTTQLNRQLDQALVQLRG